MNLSLKKTISCFLTLCLLLSLAWLFPVTASATDAETAEPTESAEPAEPTEIVIKKILTQLTAGPVVLSGPDRCIATTSTENLGFSYGWYDSNGTLVSGNFDEGNYDLIMYFTAAGGYVISSEVAVYLNNSDRDLIISVASDGKSATVRKRFEASIWRPNVIKHPGDETVSEGGWVSYVATATFAESVTWELTSPDGKTTIDAEQAIQEFPGVNLHNNDVDKIVFYNVQPAMNGWKLVAVFHGAQGLTTRSEATVLSVTSESGSAAQTTPAPDKDAPEESAAPEETSPAPEETSPAPTEPSPAPEQTHEHSFSNTWSFDEQSHWHSCSGCEERDAEEAHSLVWTETVKASRVSPGEEEGVCEVCNYTTTRETQYEGKGSFLQSIPLQYPVLGILGLIVVLIAAECIRSAVANRRR